MKLSKDFLIHISGGKTDLIPVGGAAFSGIMRGNQTLGTILELLKSETTEEEIVSAMKEKYNAPDGIIERDVKKALSELRGIGALDE
ncbi:MAG: PqqD family protein [Clostridia bacterium]|nr:PqqD family protein [Clostridia bacterium]